MMTQMAQPFAGKSPNFMSNPLPESVPRCASVSPPRLPTIRELDPGSLEGLSDDPVGKGIEGCEIPRTFSVENHLRWQANFLGEPPERQPEKGSSSMYLSSRDHVPFAARSGQRLSDRNRP